MIKRDNDLEGDNKQLIHELWQQQNGLCYYSGKPIDLKKDYMLLSLNNFPPTSTKEKNNYTLSFRSEMLLFNTSGPVVYDKERVFFSHIPKNGGSTIRKLWSDKAMWSLSAQERKHFYNNRLDITHLTLDTIEAELPDLYQKIITYESYAIIRDPFERFPSSLAQRLKLFKGKQIADLKQEEIENEIQEVVTYLFSNRNETGMLDAEFIHFQKQVDYIFNKNKQIIKNVYPIDKMSVLFKKLNHILGEPSETLKHNTKKNQTLMFKNKQLRNLYTVSFNLKLNTILRLLPKTVKENIKSMFYKHFDASKKYDVFKSQQVTHFIHSYYNKDIEFYRKTTNDI